MYLCASLRAWLVKAPEESHFQHSPSFTSPLALLSARHRMYLMRIVRCACAALSFPGRLFLICLLLDTFYLACIYETALLPPSLEKDNASASVNTSVRSSPTSSASSSSSSLSSPVAAPPAAALLPSSSSLSSSSRSVEELHRGNGSFNGTGSVSPESDSTENASIGNDNLHHSKSSKGNSDDDAVGGTGGGGGGGGGGNKQAVSSSPRPAKEFPMALVVASSTAAVSILVFFCLSYLWHTRQLDRRAQKLAIRLAAEADEIKCSQCRTAPSSYPPGSSQDSGSESGGEEACVLPRPLTLLDELDSLNEEDENEAEASDGSRRKPGGVGRTLGNRRGSRGRGRRSGSRSSRKWSSHSGGHNRNSLITDKEILNHFASRRHSTFFI